MPGYVINPGDHVDAPLSNYLGAYVPIGGIADTVCPVVPVRRRSDKYYTWDKAAFLRANDDQRRARGTRPRVVEPTESINGYLALEYELATLIEDSDLANTDSVLRLEQAKATYLAGLLAVGREKRVAAALRLAANSGQLGTSGTTLSGANQWDNGSFVAANLQINVNTGREAIRSATGYDANYIVIPKAVAKVVSQNTSIQTLVQYQGGIEYVTESQIPGPGQSAGGYNQQRYLPARLFGLNVLEPGMVENTAAEGAAFAAGDVWGKDVRILYVSPGPPMMEVPSAAYTFRSTEYGTAGWNVRRWREDGTRGNYIGTGVIDAELAVATDMAYVIAAAIS